MVSAISSNLYRINDSKIYENSLKNNKLPYFRENLNIKKGKNPSFGGGGWEIFKRSLLVCSIFAAAGAIGAVIFGSFAHLIPVKLPPVDPGHIPTTNLSPKNLIHLVHA